MSDPLPQITDALLSVFGPLGSALSDAKLATGLFAELGMEVQLDESALGELQRAAPGLARLVNEFMPLAQGYAESGTLSASDALAVLEIAAAVRQDIEALSSAGNVALARLPAPLDEPATWVSLAPQLLGTLVVSWLDSAMPAVSVPLRLCGVARSWYNANGRRRRSASWSLLGDLLEDGPAAFRAALGWDKGLDLEALTALVHELARVIGLDVTWAVRPSRVIDERFPNGLPSGITPVTLHARGAADSLVLGAPALAILPIPEVPDGPIRGVALLDASNIELGVELPLSPPWTLTLSGDPPGEDFAVELLPGIAPKVTGDAALDLGLLLRGIPDTPWILIGAQTGMHLQLEGLELEARASGRPSSLETTLRIAAVGSGLSLVIPAGSGDNFIGSVLTHDVELGVTPELLWSSKNGFSLDGSVELAFVLPLGLPLGPLSIDRLAVALVLGETSEVEFGLVLFATIGPFHAEVEGLGLAVQLTASADGTGVVGPFDASLRFVPPTRIGFEIDSETTRGAGFVSIDPELGRYAGALSLDIVSVGIDAIVVIDTQLPGDPRGWALFASLAASFPGIPLGFGFTLQGVGGLLALHRSLDAEALAAGLRSGVIDALLFPDDPLGDSAELIAQIDEYFPLQADNTVIGPVIEVGWGSPTLITAQLGVVISMPDGVIAVMGSVEALLPTPDAPLITLHMDSLGVIDLAAGTFALTASLYDSRLLATIDLCGDMATYLQLGDLPYFLLSVGGYHPGFEPPSLVPASFHELQRMQASIAIASTVSITVEAYLAVTSNSVQFGSSVHVIASVEIWPTTYTAKGWLSFDVLLVFSPFKIEAAMSAGVGIYAGNKELLGVTLSLLLEGPKPWYAVGNASFKFFGLKVAFELEVGSRAAGEPKPIAHPREDVLRALALPSSWSELAPIDGWTSGITYAAASDDGTVWVRPDHSLQVRQSVAPLNRTLDIVGQAVPAAGEALITVTGAGFAEADVTWELAEDWFAPAQFELLGRTEKLSRASFERMPAGVTFGPPAAAILSDAGAFASVTTDYEDETWKPDPTADPLGHSVRTGAAASGVYRAPIAVSAPQFTIAPARYTLVRAADGALAVDRLAAAGASVNGSSQHEALAVRRAAIAADESLAARLLLVPISAALEPLA